MDDRTSPANPRLSILRREVDQTVLKPFRSHGWSARIVRETDGHDCIEVAAERGALATRIAVLYNSNGISKSDYGVLSNRVQRIFFNGLLYYARIVRERRHRSRRTARRLLLVSRRSQQASRTGSLAASHAPQAGLGSTPDGGEPHRGDPRTPVNRSLAELWPAGRVRAV